MASFGWSSTGVQIANHYGPNSLKDVVIVMTGATDGIGLETALVFLEQGAHLLVGYRNEEKLQKLHSLADERRKKAEQTSGGLYSAKLDMKSLAKVRAFCDEAEKILDSQLNSKINMLNLNAGVFIGDNTKTEDNFECNIGINHIAHFLIYQRLSSRLSKWQNAAGAAQLPRVILTSSGSAFMSGEINLESIPDGIKSPGVQGLYAQSKLANFYMAQYIQQNSQGSVVAMALHPGSMIQTSITRESLVARILFSVISYWTKTIAQGSSTSVFAALTPELEQQALDSPSALFLNDCKVAYPVKLKDESIFINKEHRDALWQKSIELTKEYNQ